MVRGLASSTGVRSARWANTASSATASRGAWSAYTRFAEGDSSNAYRMVQVRVSGWVRCEWVPVRGARTPHRHPATSLARLLAQLEGLHHVVDLDVVEAPERQAALEALPHLGHVVLLAPQRGDGQVVGDHRAVADQAGAGVAPDRARAHQAPGDGAEPAGPEDRADLGRAQLDLLVHRLEQALERRLDLLQGLVDDGVVPDRSEERRVGKGQCSRWAGDVYKY